MNKQTKITKADLPTANDLAVSILHAARAADYAATMAAYIAHANKSETAMRHVANLIGEAVTGKVRAFPKHDTGRRKVTRDKFRIICGRPLKKIGLSLSLEFDKDADIVTVSIEEAGQPRKGNNGGGRKPAAMASATVKAEAEKIAAAIVAKREKELAAMADNDKTLAKKPAAEKLTIVSGLLPSMSDDALRQIIEQAQAIMAKRQATADALRVKRPRRERASTIAETLPPVTGKDSGKPADKAAH